MNNNLKDSSHAKCKYGRRISIGEEKSVGTVLGNYKCPDCNCRKSLTKEEYYEQMMR